MQPISLPVPPVPPSPLPVYFETRLGTMMLGDSLKMLRTCITDSSIDLIVTSPPFALVNKKAYGNADAADYLNWFRPFAVEFHRVLRDSGSLVIDIGGAWTAGQPTKSLYQYELLIMLAKEFGFHLAQEFFWFNPSKLPSPAEWVTVQRIRVKDSVNCVWWLSKSPRPKANNRRVLVPYSDSMRSLIQTGCKDQVRPSGHTISTHFARDNGGAIRSNLLTFPNTESNSAYQHYCRTMGIKPHPARFPAALPEVFIEMLTDQADLVVDPFAGSCTTGQVCERLRRRWICCDMVEEYLKGAVGRFEACSPAVHHGDASSKTSNRNLARG